MTAISNPVLLQDWLNNKNVHVSKFFDVNDFIGDFIKFMQVFLFECFVYRMYIVIYLASLYFRNFCKTFFN